MTTQEASCLQPVDIVAKWKAEDAAAKLKNQAIHRTGPHSLTIPLHTIPDRGRICRFNLPEGDWSIVCGPLTHKLGHSYKPREVCLVSNGTTLVTLGGHT